MFMVLTERTYRIEFSTTIKIKSYLSLTKATKSARNRYMDTQWGGVLFTGHRPIGDYLISVSLLSPQIKHRRVHVIRIKQRVRNQTG